MATNGKKALKPCIKASIFCGNSGVKTLNITDKTGPLLAIKNVSNEDDLMIITKSGITIRMHVDTLRTMGRAAQGVRLINLKGTAAIAAVARVPRSEDEDEDVIIGEDGEIIIPTEINPEDNIETSEENEEEQAD